MHNNNNQTWISLYSTLAVKLLYKKKRLGAVSSVCAWRPKQLRKPVLRPVQKSAVSILEMLLGLLIAE
jgi:hypothetical protein